MNDITKSTVELINNIKSNENCNIEVSKDNKLVLRIEKDNKLRYIGSKYSVQRDIENFINSIGNDINEETVFIIFGFGAGEHIKYLYSKIIDKNKIFIVEPSAEVIKQILNIDDCMKILNDDRIALCFMDDGIRKKLKDFIKKHTLDNVKVVAFSNYNVIFENEYNILMNEFKNVKKAEKIENNTLNTFSSLFFNNYIKNIFALDEFYTVNFLKNKFEGKPAVIVSAGPSLNKNIHLLKEVQDKFIIITGPRTLGILIKNGITPDFLCEVDPQEEVYDFVKDYIDLNIPLVFMDSASSKLVKEQKGLKIIAANQGMEKYLEEMLGVEVDSLIQGGSVAHFCMGLAVYMGCSTVIFIGQDLAYTNEKFQAEGTYAGEEIDGLKYRYENNKEEWDKDKNYSLYVKDIYGNKVRTSSILNSYREEFEDLIESLNEIKFINSTESGADIKGTEVMGLKDSIKLYGLEVLNKNLEEILGSKITMDEDEFINKMIKVIDKLEIIKKACEEGLEYSDKMLHFYKDNRKCNINKVFRELDRIDSVINNKEDIGFFAYKVVSAINSVLQNDTFKEKENESERECGIRLAKKSFGVYLVVLLTIEDMIFQIENRLKSYQFNNIINNNHLYENSLREHNLMNIDVIFGDYSYDNNLLNICVKKDTVYNGTGYKSIVLLDNNYKCNKICIEFLLEKKTTVYFVFINDKTTSFYNKIKNSRTSSRYDFNKHIFYSFFIENENIGLNVNYYGINIKQKIKNVNVQENNKIVFDFNNRVLLFNDEMMNINKYFIDKYLTTKALGVINSSEYDGAKFTFKKYWTI
ncbi:MAG: motility associated factor glycosyltransferase family protein [Clostridium thermopalmarium]|uniref:motility associated factor glycosyltransferase family protein n=1 Tax=Clostridium thermopalmarium TaxID=29373 RepID=UPI0023523477|nr:6-hydroxymethylpterin diphosphokinase MptE-like protein [Clostridium thermopalmarium]MBE6044706.1 motility associated factor glycosyltransferase family protein [Clostridium thermopalmarium]